MTFVSMDLRAHANVPDAVAAVIVQRIEDLLAACHAHDVDVQEGVQVRRLMADAPAVEAALDAPPVEAVPSADAPAA